MGTRHNDLTPTIVVGRQRSKKGNWTRKRLRRHRLEAATKLGHAKTPGHKRQAKEAQRQSSVQWFMRYMETVKRDDVDRRKRLEREWKERHGTQA